MPDTAFVQASSNASAAIAATTWSITLNGTTAGNTLMLFFDARLSGPFTFAVADNQGNPWVFGQTGIISWWIVRGPIPGGNVTVTITQTAGGTNITSIVAALTEYSNTVFNGLIGAWDYTGGTFSEPAGSGVNINGFGVNAVWQPNTAYDATGATAPIQASDTDSPSHVQFVFATGISGMSAPPWNQTGGTTTDNTVTWDDLYNPATTPTGALVTLMIASQPFVEFPSPGAGWTQRTQASNFGAITMYDRIGPWNASYTFAAAKSVDTYDLDSSLHVIPGFFAPVAGAGNFEGTFVGFSKAGHFGGGVN